MCIWAKALEYTFISMEFWPGLDQPLGKKNPMSSMSQITCDRHIYSLLFRPQLFIVGSVSIFRWTFWRLKIASLPFGSVFAGKILLFRFQLIIRSRSFFSWLFYEMVYIIMDTYTQQEQWNRTHTQNMSVVRFFSRKISKKSKMFDLKWKESRTETTFRNA